MKCNAIEKGKRNYYHFKKTIIIIIIIPLPERQTDRQWKKSMKNDDD